MPGLFCVPRRLEQVAKDGEEGCGSKRRVEGNVGNAGPGECARADASAVADCRIDDRTGKEQRGKRIHSEGPDRMPAKQFRERAGGPAPRALQVQIGEDGTAWIEVARGRRAKPQQDGAEGEYRQAHVGDEATSVAGCPKYQTVAPPKRAARLISLIRLR